MSDTTLIEWATATWNPWEGCTKVSPGCTHCYAAAGVPCFVKQLGARPYQPSQHEGATGYELAISHPKGGSPAEWPAGLRVRQFPKGVTL